MSSSRLSTRNSGSVSMATSIQGCAPLQLRARDPKRHYAHPGTGPSDGSGAAALRILAAQLLSHLLRHGVDLLRHRVDGAVSSVFNFSSVSASWKSWSAFACWNAA